MADASSVVSDAGTGAALGAAGGPVGSLIGGGVGALGGLAGLLLSQPDSTAANNQLQSNLAGSQGIVAPTAQQLQVALQNYSQVGNINPALQTTVSQNNSALNNYQTDPRLVAAQMQQLQTLQRLGSTGISPEQKAQLNVLNNQVNASDQARNQSLLAANAQRGMGGAGATLAAQLQSSQQASNQQAQQSDALASTAYQNALQATSQAGGLAQQMQQAQYGQAANTAAQQNAINQFNAANAQQVQGQNVGAQNQAQYYNVGTAQQIANQNTGVVNQQALYNSQAQNQAETDALARQSGINNAGTAVASNDMGQANQIATTATGAGSAIGNGLAAYINGPATTPPPTTNSAQQTYNNSQNQGSQTNLTMPAFGS